jgi:hypothetical protein
MVAAKAIWRRFLFVSNRADMPLIRIGRLDFAALASFFLPFLLYSLTLAPTIYNLDSAELTTAAATGGILRATGYPLYLLLGKLWSLLPIGDVGYRMNLFSAFCGAGTIFLADQILRRLNIGTWARLGSLGLLAAAPYFWALSLIAEVYTLHTLLMGAILLALLRCGTEPDWRSFCLPWFLLGLSMGNHAATVLLIPGILIYCLLRFPQRLLRPRMGLAAAAALVAGLSVYLIIPFRFASGPDFNYAGDFDSGGIFNPVNLSTPAGLLWLVTGRAFSGQMFAYRLAEILPEIVRFALDLSRAFFVVGVLPGLVGLVVLTRRSKAFGLSLLAMASVNAAFFINYRVIDKATMFLPVYLIWAIWLGCGYQVLIDWLSKVDSRRAATWFARGLPVVAVVSAVLWNWANVDLSHDWSTRLRSERILRVVEEDAIVFGWWDTIPGIQYLQLVEGQRPDVLAINRFLISGEDMNELILSQVGTRPVYINNPSIEILQKAVATKVGPLYRLEGKAKE